MMTNNDFATIQQIVRRELTGSIISSVMRSNLYTMNAVAQVDPDKAIPDNPGIPADSVRKLRSRLLVEEVMETLRGLGCWVNNDGNVDLTIETGIVSSVSPNLEDIIDGCCDLIYVAVGTLAACGVPDIPHLELVCRANNAKFPDGKATVNEYGKFQKPEGWKPPVHAELYEAQSVDIKTLVK